MRSEVSQVPKSETPGAPKFGGIEASWNSGPRAPKFGGIEASWDSGPGAPKFGGIEASWDPGHLPTTDIVPEGTMGPDHPVRIFSGAIYLAM